MNTDSNTNLDAVTSDSSSPMSRQIIKALDSCAIHMPISRMMQELQVIIERLTFGSESFGEKIGEGDIQVLLGSDVSPEMTTFVMWLYRYNLTGLMIGRHGQHFLAFCAKYYRSVREVRCTLPIAARDEFQKTLIGHLRAVYPEPARIIFETSASVLAGVVIDDGQKKTDMSLAAKLPDLTGEYMAAMRAQKAGASGN